VSVDELSVFFPAYNEAANLPRTIEGATTALASLGLDRYEIVVVDDGSEDATVAVVDDIAAGDPRVRLVQHPHNLGYGAALRTGLASAQYEWVFWTDADGQFDMRELALLTPHTDTADLVVGYRLQRADHLGRRVNTFVWNRLVRTVLGLRVRDVDCAFKLVRRRAVEQVPPIESDGALASAELLVKLQRANVPCIEVGVHHYPRVAGEPTGANIRVIARALRDLLRQRRQLVRTTSATPEHR
jgi:glycosyltransferase involved in cell wall biosynthesis